MPSNFTNLDRFLSDFEDDARQGMQELAELTEDYIKDNQNWEDDTGSLRASITGHEIKIGDPQKNFGDQDWKDAQAGRRRSRYLNAYPQNTPDHYQPYTEPATVSDDNPVAIVSAFVKYGLGVEQDLLVGGTFHEGLDFMERQALPVLKRHIKL